MRDFLAYLAMSLVMLVLYSAVVPDHGWFLLALCLAVLVIVSFKVVGGEPIPELVVIAYDYHGESVDL